MVPKPPKPKGPTCWDCGPGKSRHLNVDGLRVRYTGDPLRVLRQYVIRGASLQQAAPDCICETHCVCVTTSLTISGCNAIR